MSAAILPELALSPDRIRFTREQAEKMAEAGLIEGRYELLEGDLISKMGQKPAHAHIIRALNDLLSRQFGGGRVQIQLPVRLPDPAGRYSEPEPDVALLAQQSREFISRHPGPEDTVLVIEVSDTTFDRDRGAKYRLYAAAGIVEYWIVDLQQCRTFVCRRPEGNEYRSVEIVAANEPVTALLEPALTLTLDSLLA